MWFLFIHGIFAFWVFIDSSKRRGNSILWVIGTIMLGPIILPEYLSKRPLKANEAGVSVRYHKLFKNLAIFWTLLLVLLSIWSQKTNIYSAGEYNTLEYRLAVLNTENQVRKDDPVITQFSLLLDQLSEKCIENREQIANISVIANNRMKAYGIDESLLNIMEDLNKLIDLGTKNQKYNECLYCYIGFRKDGLSHNEAIDRYRATIKGY